MTLGLHQPIPGGSEYHIEFDGPKQKEVITIYLPPVGYTIDRIPDPETGVPSYQLIKCEILGEDLPLEKQKWIKPQLPKDWSKWRDEERRQHRFNKDFVHPEAEKFRAQEWTRRINGCWQALGNRNGNPTEYVYITPGAYFYFAWWKPDFGSPTFGKVYLKTFYALAWAEDHPMVNGIILSTYRRHGKTAIAGCWTVDAPSRNEFFYGGLQGQAGKKALEFFDIHLLQPFRRLEEVDFFMPEYDRQASQKSQLLFTNPPPRTAKVKKNEPLNFDDNTRKPLGGRITCANSSETAFDGKKMHRIWLEEPGKWIEADVLKTVTTYVPCTKDNRRRKIGLMFVPSTVEEMDKGGQEFVNLFEKSVPSLMNINKNGKTITELVSMFIPAYEGVIFDEYGRSVVDDPEPGEIILDDAGRQITQGAKSFLKAERDSKDTDDDKIKEMRQYPWSWFEAKMMSAINCKFNAKIITSRLEQLRAMKKLPYIRGNFQWTNEIDGDTEFVRDDIAGRFQVSWLPDMEGGMRENSTKIINNVGFEWGEDFKGDKIKLWYPRNDLLFVAGCDPIAYRDAKKSKERRLSKGAAHIFRKFDASVDSGKHQSEWESHNFVCQYLFRPDTFEEFGEDIVKMIRYWGCSINPEDNASALRQYLDKRGYGAFILFRRDFDNVAIMGNGDADKVIRSNPEVIDTYTNRLNTWFFRHGMRCQFPELLEQALQFDPTDTQKFDCVVSAGFTLIGSEKRMDTEDRNDTLDITSLFPVYDNSGHRSKAI
jgi:hypothetical protein